MLKQTLIALAVYALCVIAVAGCASTRGQHQGLIEITLPDGATYRHDTRAKGETIAPPNASTPSPLSVGANGVNGESGATYERTAASYVAENTWIAYIIAGLLAVGAAFAAWRGKIILAVGLGIGAGGVGLLPHVGPAIATPLAYLIVAAIVCAVVYAVGTWFGVFDLRRKAKPAIAKLTKEGKKDEAIAIARAVDPALDRTFKAGASK